MNWNKKIKAILGFFWTTVWQDSWLLDVIVKFFVFLIGNNIQSRLLSIMKQTQCKSLYIPETKRYVRVLVDSNVSSGTILLSDMTIGTSQVGEDTSMKSYNTLQQMDCPDYFQLGVSNTETKLIKDIDFHYYADRNVMQFEKTLPEYGFQMSVELVRGIPCSCYVLWAVYQEYRTVRDSFTQIAGIPSEWAWKYPGAMEAAWSIKQNGANERDVKRLLGAVGGCPFSTISGKIKVDGLTASIGDIVYKGTGSALVSSGNGVPEDTKLFTGEDQAAPPDKFPSVYTYKTGLPQELRGIHVLTQVGVLYAPDQSDSISDSVLPLLTSPSGSVSEAYKELCRSRSEDTTIPYAELPEVVNPAQYIFQKVWGPSAVLIMTPPSNQADMKTAVEFIVENTQLGTLILAYSYNGGSPVLLYPNERVQQEQMIYYNTSINNGTSYKERLGDLVE